MKLRIFKPFRIVILFAANLFLVSVVAAQSDDRCLKVPDLNGNMRLVCQNDSQYPRYHEPKADLAYHGIPCTVDCSGHEAGYNWGKKKGITDPEKCTGKSLSFVEGCRVAAAGN